MTHGMGTDGKYSGTGRFCQTAFPKNILVALSPFFYYNLDEWGRQASTGASRHGLHTGSHQPATRWKTNTRQQQRVRLSRLIAANALPGSRPWSPEPGVISMGFSPLSFPRWRGETTVGTASNKVPVGGRLLGLNKRRLSM